MLQVVSLNNHIEYCGISLKSFSSLKWVFMSGSNSSASVC